MKERQRWKSEEDALLRAYVRQYGPREWNLVSQRMNVPFHRDAKSCLERWKNYLKPGIKKGSLSEEEQHLVIHLQAKHGNKWKKIAAEVPGRTAKRLGKWWEVFKEKQQRELQENNKTVIEPLAEGKYDQLFENFAEKLVKERTSVPFLMAAPLLPPWLSNPSNPSGIRPPSPSVTLSLSSSNAHADPAPWMHPERTDNNVVLSNSENAMVQRGLADNTVVFTGSQNGMTPIGLTADGLLVSEIAECCRQLEEGHQAWLTHKKETSWRLKRVELLLESEKAKKRREKIEEIESKIRALEEEQKVTLERIDAEYKEQILGFWKDAEAKEQKLIDQWVLKHMRLAKFLERMGGYKQ